MLLTWYALPNNNITYVIDLRRPPNNNITLLLTLDAHQITILLYVIDSRRPPNNNITLCY